jgi:hypothetical protein
MHEKSNISIRELKELTAETGVAPVVRSQMRTTH